MELLQSLDWRYATKKMNGTKVAQEKIDNILEATRLAPSSSGFQPYKVFVITDPELKAKIQPIAYGQSQIVDASHVLVFAAWDKYTDERIDNFFQFSNEERGLPQSTTDDYKATVKAQFASMTEEQHAAHAAKQAYIAMGFTLVAAAVEQVDATPMEGFNNEALDELLALKNHGLKSATIVTLGYRDEQNDWLVNMKKVREPKESFFINM